MMILQRHLIEEHRHSEICHHLFRSQIQKILHQPWSKKQWFYVVSLIAVCFISVTNGFCPDGEIVTKQRLKAEYKQRTHLISLTECSFVRSIQLGAFRIFSNLRELRLNGNKISTIKNGTFEGLANLRRLNLSHNNLTTVENGAFVELVQLRKLSLLGNQLSVIESGMFKGLTNLHNLLLQNNEITSVEKDAFLMLSQLRVLKLNNNKLSVIENGTFEGLVNLGVLRLDNNKIVTVEKGAFAVLSLVETLDFDNNKMKVIEHGLFTGLTNLRRLWIKKNKIETVQKGALSVLSLLEELYLDRNKLSVIENGTFDGLTSLRMLWLTDNYVVTIENGAFVALTNVLDLYLVNNQVAKITDAMFEGLDNLSILDISTNRITTLSEDARWIMSTKNIDLSDNRFHCDCSMAWLFDLNIIENSINNTLSSIDCFSPIRGQLLSNKIMFDSCEAAPLKTTVIKFEFVTVTVKTTTIEITESKGNKIQVLFIAGLTSVGVLIIFTIIIVMIVKSRRHRRPDNPRGDPPSVAMNTVSECYSSGVSSNVTFLRDSHLYESIPNINESLTDSYLLPSCTCGNKCNRAQDTQDTCRYENIPETNDIVADSYLLPYANKSIREEKQESDSEYINDEAAPYYLSLI